jgi:hypothetical protein
MALQRQEQHASPKHFVVDHVAAHIVITKQAVT